MRTLVIGGSGYVGSLMLPGLADRHEIRVLDLVAPADGIEHVVGSALDPAALAEALDGVDVVVHAAMGRPSDTDWPMPDVNSAFEVNVASVYATLAAAHKAGVRRAVVISSMSVFKDLDHIDDPSLDETFEPDASDVYGVTKRLAEQVARIAADAYGMTVTVLRLSFPTSDEAWPRWAVQFEPEPVQIRRSDGSPVPGLAATDLVNAMDAALGREGGYDVFHILGDDGSGRCWTTAKAREQLGWVARRR